MTWQVWALKWLLDAIVILSMFSTFLDWGRLTKPSRRFCGLFAAIFLCFQGYLTFRLLGIRPDGGEFLAWFLMIGAIVMLLREMGILGRMIEKSE